MNMVSVTPQDTMTDRVVVRREGQVVGRGTVTLVNVIGDKRTYRIVNHLTRERIVITTSRDAAIARMVDTVPLPA